MFFHVAEQKIIASGHFADKLLEAIAQLPDYEYYSLAADIEQQQRFYEHVYQSCGKELDAIVAAIRQNLEKRPHYAVLSGLKIDSRVLVLIVMSLALGQIVRPAGVEADAEINSSAENVVMKNFHPFARLHTDSTNWDVPNDVTCLACIRPDQDGGGKSIIMDVEAVLEELEHEPSLSALVRREDIPWTIPQDDGVIAKYFPILDEENRLRWYRKNIEVALDWAGGQLAPEVTELVGKFENLLEHSEKKHIFGLEANEILFINNRKSLHARTQVKNQYSTERKFLRTRLYLHPQG